MNKLIDPEVPATTRIVPRLIAELLATLRSENILYCHWKSNDKLELTAVAETDLDLLVSREQAERFTRILKEAGFKQALAPEERRICGIIDYFGYDEPTRKFVHVHAHYQLVLGHDATKNYRLPIEQAFLESSRRSGLFRVPAPHFDYIVLVIRIILKRCTWDAILIRHGRLSAAEREELDYLRRRVSPESLSSCLERHLPFLPEAVFRDCERSLEAERPIATRILAGHRLLGALGAFGRRPRSHVVLLKIVRRIAWGVRRRLLGRTERYRFVNGGAFVAFVGGDGAGKSSAIAELDRRLAGEGKFDVLRLHLGKPPRSLVTSATRAVLKIGRALGRRPYVDHAVRYDAAWNGAFAGYACLIREVCTARDRYLAYRRGLRHASAGGVVLCDRFPLAPVRLMDGPVVAQLAGDRVDERGVRHLQAIEERYYDRIVSPELLFVLKIDPDTAVARKPEESEQFVRIRSEEIWRVADEIPGARVIDTSIPLERLSSLVWDEVWTRL